MWLLISIGILYIIFRIFAAMPFLYIATLKFIRNMLIPPLLKIKSFNELRDLSNTVDDNNYNFQRRTRSLNFQPYKSQCITQNLMCVVYLRREKYRL